MAERTKLLFGLRTNCRATLYNPVQVSETSSHTRNKNLVLFSGTLTAKKGILSLIRAWPSVIRACSDAQLHVFGKDGDAPDGRSMTECLRSELLHAAARDSVYFHGHVVREKLAEALATARLAVFPSYAEGFANAPLEAMAAACPTIYSVRGSGPELIDHGENGLLIDPDRPDDIAEAIVRLLRDDQLARKLGEAGRARVNREFSTRKILAKNEAFYQACLTDFRSRAPGADTRTCPCIT
jgi:glycosyltransferase involved in cell wall biosynthesis